MQTSSSSVRITTKEILAPPGYKIALSPRYEETYLLYNIIDETMIEVEYIFTLDGISYVRETDTGNPRKVLNTEILCEKDIEFTVSKTYLQEILGVLTTIRNSPSKCSEQKFQDELYAVISRTREVITDTENNFETS